MGSRSVLAGGCSSNPHIHVHATPRHASIFEPMQEPRIPCVVERCHTCIRHVSSTARNSSTLLDSLLASRWGYVFPLAELM